jgi:hypothetical protein
MADGPWTREKDRASCTIDCSWAMVKPFLFLYLARIKDETIGSWREREKKTYLRRSVQ